MLVFQVLLLWLWSIVVVAAPTGNSTRTASHQYDRRAAECYSQARIDTVDIDPLACTNAIRDMPTTMTPGNDISTPLGRFGNMVNAGSLFKLPRHFARGNCMIGVTMSPAGLDRTDKASWDEIAVKAAGIVSNCALLPGPARRGGRDTAGKNNQIIIEVFKYKRYLDFMLPLNNALSPASRLQANA